MNSEIIFILGGARSGKSRMAQELATGTGKKVLFVATAEPLDGEMSRRIEIHRQSRPVTWSTLESPVNVAKNILSAIREEKVIVIDCLTLLVSNIMMAHTNGGREDEPDEKRIKESVLREISGLEDLFKKIKALYIIVSNEVGLGLVPPNKTGRVYRDVLGKANQLVAAAAGRVYYLVAGIPVKIKGS